MNMEEALVRVRSSISQSEGFALIADATDVKYLSMTNCDLQMVGDEFSRKPYALAVQQGSPLKDQLNDAWVNLFRIDHSLILNLCSILRLLNQRKLEGMKERWWNQNPNRVVSSINTLFVILSSVKLLGMLTLNQLKLFTLESFCPLDLWGGWRRYRWYLNPQHWWCLHCHLCWYLPCTDHSCYWVLVLQRQGSNFIKSGICCSTEGWGKKWGL